MSNGNTRKRETSSHLCPCKRVLFLSHSLAASTHFCCLLLSFSSTFLLRLPCLWSILVRRCRRKRQLVPLVPASRLVPLCFRSIICYFVACVRRCCCFKIPAHLDSDACPAAAATAAADMCNSCRCQRLSYCCCCFGCCLVPLAPLVKRGAASPGHEPWCRNGKEMLEKLTWKTKEAWHDPESDHLFCLRQVFVFIKLSIPSLPSSTSSHSLM